MTRRRLTPAPKTPTGAARRSGPPLSGSAGTTRWPGSEVHAAHAAVAAGHGRSVLLRLVGDDGLGGEEERRDGGGVLQRRAGDLGRVDDAGLDQVLVLARGRVEALARAQVADLLRDDATLEAGVDRDLLERGLQRDLDDVRAGGLVAVQAETLEQAGTGLDQGDAAAGDHALLDGRLRVADGVLDAVLALLELDLGRRTGLDDRNTAGQLGQALLQVLAVVVGVGPLDLGADLVNPARDLVGVAGPADDGALVLGADDLAGAAQQRQVGFLQLEADLLRDDLATGEDGHV